MNPDIEKYIKAFKTKFEFIGHKGVQCDEITVQNLEAFLTNALQSISEKTKQEGFREGHDLFCVYEECSEKHEPLEKLFGLRKKYYSEGSSKLNK